MADDASLEQRVNRAGWLAGATGLAAVGSIAGVSVTRSLSRRRRRLDDLYRDEDFGLLGADRGCVVTTADGVPLEVREVGPADAALTVLFVHGYCLRMGAFHFQRKHLQQVWGPQVRMVFYDQRGHGRSGEALADTYTISQLGQDLAAVLDVMAPRGPVVLVGHSMGGMTVLSHAARHPAEYGKRIAGVALIATAAEGVASSPLGELLKNPALNAARLAVRVSPRLMHRGRGAARAVLQPVMQAASFGERRVSPVVAAFAAQMNHDTPIATVVEFLRALELHDETAALPVLAAVPTLIVCGTRDLLTPLAGSQAMAAALPDAELVVVERAGHLVQLERPDVVDDALVRLVERAMPSKLVTLTRRVLDRTRPRG